MIRLKVRVSGFRDYQTTWRTHWALLWLRNLSFHRGRGRKDSRGPIKGSLLILSTSSLPRRHRHSFIYLHRTATMHMQVHPFMEWGRRTFLTALRGRADNAYIYRSMCFAFAVMLANLGRRTPVSSMSGIVPISTTPSPAIGNQLVPNIPVDEHHIGL
jgi:hypothetical protein